jgi:arabinofuranosyltransferase
MSLLNLSPGRTIISLALLIALSIPIPWVHHFEEKKITELKVADTVKIKVSNKLPFFLKPLARLNEHLQSWLLDHLVCVRWQEHRMFLIGQLEFFPQRSLELPSEAGPFPVAYFSTVGVAGWVLPKVAVIDGYGLNDYVIARLPIDPGIKRMMAHDRFAPHAYVVSFLPNVNIMSSGKVRYRQRPPDFELTREKIIAYEKFWDDKFVKQMDIPDSLAPFPTKPE